MKSNYSNYYAYFNSQLHKKHSSVIKTLVPDDDNRFVASVTQQPIQLLSMIIISYTVLFIQS